MIKFLRSCCQNGILNLNIKDSSKIKSDKMLLKYFIDSTVGQTTPRKSKKSTDRKSSESSELDFSDDKDDECYLYNKENKQPKINKKTRKRTGKTELDKLYEDIDRSFLKSELLKLKSRPHKKVDYGIDTRSTTSDDSDDFIYTVNKNRHNILEKKKRIQRRRISSSNSSKSQHGEDESDESEIFKIKKSSRAKRLKYSDSEQTTADSFVANSIEITKNVECENRSTPDIEFHNNPRIQSFINIDKDIDTDCSSGETVHKNCEYEYLDSDDFENEENGKYHFITVEQITGCRVEINKLGISHKSGPIKVFCKNGIWKINQEKSYELENDHNGNTSNINDKSNDLTKDIQKTSDCEINKRSPITSELKNIEEKNIDCQVSSESTNECTTLDVEHERESDKSESDYILISKASKAEEEMDSKSEESFNISISENSNYDLKEIDSLKDLPTQLEIALIEEENVLNVSLSRNNDNNPLYINEVDTETNNQEKKNTEVLNNQHAVTKIKTENSDPIHNKITDNTIEEVISIEDSEEIACSSGTEEQINKLETNSSASYQPKKKNCTLKKNLVIKRNISKRTANIALSQKQKSITKNISTTERSPMSVLLANSERKVSNLSYISCRAGYQFRCLDKCKYYNLNEDSFRYHILSRHAIDKWSGFCDLCNKSFTNSIRPLIDEYEHMIQYHIKPEIKQKLRMKEDRNLVVEHENVDDNSDTISQTSITEEENSNSKSASKISSQESSNISISENSKDIQKGTDNLNDLATQPEITLDSITQSDNIPESSVESNLNLKPTLRIKCLPGDKLSSKSNLQFHLNEVNYVTTFKDCSELEKARIEQTISSIPLNQNKMQDNISPIISWVDTNKCIPSTTVQQEAILQSVIEENISRYDPSFAQPQPQITINPTEAPVYQTNTTSSYGNSNASVMCTPSVTRTVNNIQCVQSVQQMCIQNKYINSTISIQPTIALNLNQNKNISHQQTSNAYAAISTAVTSSNLQILNQNGQVQYSNESSTYPINTMQNSSASFQNQISRTSNNCATDLCKTRLLRPWLNIDDLKTRYCIDKCLNRDYLLQLYKCMYISCTFATNNINDFSSHLHLHQKNVKKLIFCCCYCPFNTEIPGLLLTHITEKYSNCNYSCKRCFYRTSSLYNATEHGKIHENFQEADIMLNSSIQPILEDQEFKEFKRIKLRNLPSMICFICAQKFETYGQYNKHIGQCFKGSAVECQLCHETLELNNLENHTTNCYGIFTFNCCYCTFGTQILSNMSEHMVHLHMEKIPFYIERTDTSHLPSISMKKAAFIKKFKSNGIN